MHTGLLTSWNDAKGFGFIKSATLSHDTFIHISALKQMSRKPKVGDTIYFDVAQQSDGKSRAINCRIEGVIESKIENIAAFNTPVKMSKAKKKSSTLANLVALAIILSIGFSAYNRYFANTHTGNKNNTPVITNAKLYHFSTLFRKMISAIIGQ
jgi:cold shock CspA family protein